MITINKTINTNGFAKTIRSQMGTLTLELFAVPDCERLHGEDLVHEFPGAEAVLVDHVRRLVVAHRAVLVAGAVPPRLQRLHTSHVTRCVTWVVHKIRDWRMPMH